MALEDAASLHHHRYERFLEHHGIQTDLLSSAIVESEERGLMQIEDILSHFSTQVSSTQMSLAQEREIHEMSHEDRTSQHIRFIDMLESESASHKNSQQDFDRRIDMIKLEATQG